MEGNTFILKDYKALGTTWYIELFSIIDLADLKDAETRIRFEIEKFQAKYSRFENNSLLQQLNRNKNVPFDHDLFTMLEQGERWRIKTDGVFDIGIKDTLENIGYGASKNSDAPLQQLQPSGESRVTKTPNSIIWNSRENIDLGGIGKGYLIDKLAKILQEDFKIHYFLINGGGDIFVTSNKGKSVELFLEHPTDPKQYIGKVDIKDASLCVSSSYKRTWEKNGQKYNHLIDTKQNKIVEGAAYVIAKDATTADILATVLALHADSAEFVSVISAEDAAEFLTLGESGHIHASNRFKIALEAL